jgi:transcriptional regulator with XRE-family HTH domain
MDSRHYLPAKLAKARELEGKTQQEIAAALNVDRQTIYRAEAGKSVSYELLAEMCRIYGIPMTSIIIPVPDLAAS